MAASVSGSSPLTRGKPGWRLAVEGFGGLIPAHAGKTQSTPSPTSASSAHPRSRGENLRTVRFAASESGSSPLTRGKRAVAGLDDDGRGLIPAHAGKT